MPCPFPGMDPYLERPELWLDFHNRLVAAICGELQPQLRPHYIAITEQRLYVMESQRPIRPNVTISQFPDSPRRAVPPDGVLTPDAPTAVFETAIDEIRESLVTIVDPRRNNQVITAIEVLSPDNKRPGPGRASYLQRREELLQSGANLVEIDLLRGGTVTVHLSAECLEQLAAWDYLTVVSRKTPPRIEVYTTKLFERLPRLGVPLAPADPDVPLDLQRAFTRCWDEGPYPELLGYDQPPPGPLDSAQAAECRKLVAVAAAG